MLFRSAAVTPTAGGGAEGGPSTPAARAVATLHLHVTLAPRGSRNAGSPITTGRVPANTTRVVQRATRLGTATSMGHRHATAAAMARRTIMVACRIRRVGRVRTVRCTPRLPIGKWRLVTSAFDGTRVIARGTNVVRVRSLARRKVVSG